MVKLAEVFKIKEVGETPFSRSAALAGPTSPGSGPFSKNFKRLDSSRAGGLINITLLKALEVAAAELDKNVDTSASSSGDDIDLAWSKLISGLTTHVYDTDQ